MWNLIECKKFKTFPWEYPKYTYLPKISAKYRLVSVKVVCCWRFWIFSVNCLSTWASSFRLKRRTLIKIVSKSTSLWEIPNRVHPLLFFLIIGFIFTDKRHQLTFPGTSVFEILLDYGHARRKIHVCDRNSLVILLVLGSHSRMFPYPGHELSHFLVVLSPEEVVLGLVVTDRVLCTCPMLESY